MRRLNRELVFVNIVLVTLPFFIGIAFIYYWKYSGHQLRVMALILLSVLFLYPVFDQLVYYGFVDWPWLDSGEFKISIMVTFFASTVLFWKEPLMKTLWLFSIAAVLLQGH